MVRSAVPPFAREPHPAEHPQKASRGVQSVEMCGRLLKVLAYRGSVGLAELAAAADIPPAQVHTYLVSLARLGLVKRDALLGDYEPGPLSLRLGLLHLEQRSAYRAAVPEVAALAKRVGLSVAISIAGPRGPTIVRYERAGSPLHLNLHVGSVLSLTTTSTGRVFSAFLPRERLLAMQADYTEPRGPGNGPRDFEQQLAQIRRRGIERSIDAPTPAISSMSVPVVDPEHGLQLTLTAIGPTDAIDVGWSGSVARALRAAARRIEANLHAVAMPAGAGPIAAFRLEEPPSDDKVQRGIRTLETTGELLTALVSAARPLPLRDIAAAARMPAAKAFSHLVSLLNIGLLSRDDEGCFGSGPLALELGLMALQRQSPVRDAEPEIAALASGTGLTVAAAVLGPLGPTVIRLEESALPVHVSLRVGTVMSLVNTAIGRIFAAHLPTDLLVDLLALDSLRLAGVRSESIPVAGKKDAAATPALKSDYEALLARIRTDGIDTALDTPIPGIHTLAAPVFDHTNTVCLVIAIIGSAGSFDSAIGGTPALQLLDVTRRLSRRFGWAPAEQAREAR